MLEPIFKDLESECGHLWNYLWSAVAAREYWKPSSCSSRVICFAQDTTMTSFSRAYFIQRGRYFFGSRDCFQKKTRMRASDRQHINIQKRTHCTVDSLLHWRDHFKLLPGFAAVPIQFKWGIPSLNNRFTLRALRSVPCPHYITTDWLTWRSPIRGEVERGSGEGDLTRHSCKAP